MVTVIVAVPVAMPVTTPAVLTVATLVLLELQVTFLLVALLGDTRCWTDDDAESALDNIVAAANGETCPHKDLLPWPRGSQ